MDKKSIEDLIEIIEKLRSPDGCPWDKVQTHKSIRNGLIEECYETADAIDKEDFTALCEELGDVLMQVVFHSSLAREEGRFDFDDVVGGVCEKLVYRHPHVFADVKADTVDAVLTNWEELKHKEKNQSSFTDTLESVPDAFPALMRAQKVQKRAGKAGFDWDNVDGPLSKVEEEFGELKEAISEKKSEAVFEEFGDLLFSVVNVSRFIGVDSEESLNKATDKFVARFARVEKEVEKTGRRMDEFSLEELDAVWSKVK